jgi:hypothetical protein
MNNSSDSRLKILLLNDRGPWVAICLQHYLAAQAESPTKALEALNWTYWTQVVLDNEKGIEPLSKVGKAPEEYWTRFEQGLRFATHFELKPPFSLDNNPTVAEDVRLAA